MKRKLSCFSITIILLLMIGPIVSHAETVVNEHTITLTSEYQRVGELSRAPIPATRFHRNVNGTIWTYQIKEPGLGINLQSGGTWVESTTGQTMIYSGSSSQILPAPLTQKNFPGLYPPDWPDDLVRSIIPDDAYDRTLLREDGSVLPRDNTLQSRRSDLQSLLKNRQGNGVAWDEDGFTVFLRIGDIPSTTIKHVNASAFGDFTPLGNLTVSFPNYSPTDNGIAPYTKGVKATGDFKQTEYFPPIVVSTPDLPISLGSHLVGEDYTRGVTATWGFTTINKIPTLGSITRTDVASTAPDPYFSGSDATGLIKNIGVKQIPIKIMDNSGSANPTADTTNTSRLVKSTTTSAPEIIAKIHAGAQNTQGGINPTDWDYAPWGNNPVGGVEGWTNFPLTVTVGGWDITGDYALWSVWSPPANNGVFNGSALDQSISITGAGGEAKSISRDFTEPASSSGGWRVKGYCSDKSNQSNLLSAQTSAVELKYDPYAPTAGLSFRPETKTFSDTSTDGLSGINLTRTSILFRTVGGPAPAESDGDWQLLSGYSIPVTAANYDVYVKAYDKAGNYDIRLANGNLKLHGVVEASLGTGAAAELTEGSPFSYTYTLHGTDDYAGATGSFTSYLPLGVVPTGTGFSNITSTSGNATVDGSVAASPELLGVHGGQYKVTGNYALKTATGGDTLTFEVGCRAPQYDTAPGADNTFTNQGGNVSFTMGDNFTGTADFNSVARTVRPLPMHNLTLTKTVTGKYGNRDKTFLFRLDMEQSWGAKLNRTCSYSKTNGGAGTITIKSGAIETVDGTPTDSIPLKHGQDITIKGLPEGCGYTISEEPKEGYTPSEKVDGTDYTPSALSADTDSQTSNEVGATVLKNAVKKADGKQADTSALQPGMDIAAINLSKGGDMTASKESPTFNTEMGNLDGQRDASTVAGVVKGTMNTADVRVDYFNDRNELDAPPTGIQGFGGWSGMLPAILSGLVVIGGGILLRRRK